MDERFATISFKLSAAREVVAALGLDALGRVAPGHRAGQRAVLAYARHEVADEQETEHDAGHDGHDAEHDHVHPRRAGGLRRLRAAPVGDLVDVGHERVHGGGDRSEARHDLAAGRRLLGGRGGAAPGALLVGLLEGVEAVLDAGQQLDLPALAGGQAPQLGHLGSGLLHDLGEGGLETVDLARVVVDDRHEGVLAHAGHRPAQVGDGLELLDGDGGELVGLAGHGSDAGQAVAPERERAAILAGPCSWPSTSATPRPTSASSAGTSSRRTGGWPRRARRRPTSWPRATRACSAFET
jgi:hypothetical protein